MTPLSRALDNATRRLRQTSDTPRLDAELLMAQALGIDRDRLILRPPARDQVPASFEGMDQQLVRAIHQLPPEYQTVLILWAVDELAYKEIADALGVPIGTVMSRLHRARQRLSEQLRDYAMKEGIIRE